MFQEYTTKNPLEKLTSKSFCILPWMHICSSAGGDLRVCCNSKPGKNKILKSNGATYKIYEGSESLKSAWHSPVYKKIRRQMLKGEWPEMCAPCFRQESAGVQSKRMRSNKKYMFDYDFSETPPFNIKFLDLRLGNKCNLKCRMCSPYSSSSLIKEWEQVGFIDKTESLRLKSFTAWSEDRMDFSSFLEFMPHIEEIYLTGGEPLLIKEQYDLLEYIIKKGFAPGIKLRYNTNGTKYNKNILNLWKQFRLVSLSVSIDAFGALNDYIRYPSKWSLIENNLNQMIFLEKEFSNIIVGVDCNLQMCNIVSMTDFLSWAETKNIDLSLDIVENPKCLNIRVLPKELKKKVKEELLPFRKKFPVEKIINYMEKEDWTTYLQDFFRYMDAFDKSRNQKMSDILPELYAYKSV